MRLTSQLALILVSLFALPSYAADGVAGEESQTVQAKVSVQADQKLSDVKKIFVAPLGNSECSELIRQKVINRLIKGGAVSVVESTSNADAVLRGDAEVSKRHYFVVNNGYGSGGTKFSAEGVVRLVGKNDQVLWLDEISSRKFFSHHSSNGASSDVAAKLVKRLVDAIAADRNQIAAQQASGL